MKRIGVNGFGRIGRYFTRMTLDDPGVDVAVVNDLSDIHTLAHLFKYDSVHRRLQHEFQIDGDKLVFENGKQIHFISEELPEKVQWAELGVEIVLEATGKFKNKEALSRHFSGGAKKILLSATADDADIRTVVLGVNDHLIQKGDRIISNASCTTNSAAPMVKVMKELCDIDSAFITTVHSYTTDQKLHDSPHSDLRRARAAAESIVPTTTGAAKALAKVFPELDGAIGGCGVRVPVPNGSMTDLTFVVKNPPTEEQINDAMHKASQNEMNGILDFTDEPIISVDIIGSPYSCIFDSLLTSVIGNMVKVVGWYDNEAGYSNRLIDLIKKLPE